MVACDINQDDFIDESCMGTYDVVMSFLCLDSATKDLDSYQSGVAKLVSLVKKGGYFLLHSTCRENCEVGFYVVDGTKYPNVVLKRDFVVKTLEQNGLFIETEAYLPTPTPELGNGNSEGFLFFSACKVY